MSKKCGFVPGLFVGAIIGSAVGFLCAPGSGDETRKKIVESAQGTFKDISGSIDNYSDDLKKYINEVSSGLTGKFNSYKDQLETKITNIQNEVNADIAELNEELEQLHQEEEQHKKELEAQASEPKHD